MVELLEESRGCGLNIHSLHFLGETLSLRFATPPGGCDFVLVLARVLFHLQAYNTEFHRLTQALVLCRSCAVCGCDFVGLSFLFCCSARQDDGLSNASVSLQFTDPVTKKLGSVLCSTSTHVPAGGGNRYWL